MTVVEFFDKVSIDNMVSCITLKPDKIIFVGDKKPMKKQEEVYRRFACKQGLNVEFCFKNINRNNIEKIVEVLTDIAENEENCVFDLTGGEDLVLVAMGFVYERYRHTGKLQMHRFNIVSGAVTDCDNDGNSPHIGEVSMSVEDNITLYGGMIVPFDGKKGTYKWDFDNELISDIRRLWNVSRANPGLWNALLNTLHAMSLMDMNTKTLKMTANKETLENFMKSKRLKYVWIPGMMKSFEKLGVIRELKDSDDSVSFTFKNEQIKMCLTKSGTILELMVLLSAKEMEDKNGKKIFNDTETGVFIDWDATVHEITDEEKDTENEIDVILMKGLQPVFVSCKNGYVDEAELYKLKTVAERFGGPYAKKLLVCSYLGKSTKDSYRYLKQRAADMDIELVENVHEMTDDELKKHIRSKVC